MRGGVYAFESMKMNRITTAVLAISALGGCMFTSPHHETLYDRLGERRGIEALVDTFAANCVSDTRINKYFFAVASNPEHLAMFKHNLADQICEAAGGPCVYKGRDMKTAHQGMGISDQDFNALVEDLVKALDKAEVLKADQETLLGILGPMRKEIVEKHS
jgi:hemoglobin